MGKPVVVTDVGSNRDVVEDIGGGVVVPRIGDIKALSDGVARVFAEPIDSAAVRSRIYDRFGTEKIAAQYRAAFLGNHHGRILTPGGEFLWRGRENTCLKCQWLFPLITMNTLLAKRYRASWIKQQGDLELIIVDDGSKDNSLRFWQVH